MEKEMIAKTTIEVACYPSECNTLDVEEYNKRKKMLWLPADKVKEHIEQLRQEMQKSASVNDLCYEYKRILDDFIESLDLGLEKTEASIGNKEDSQDMSILSSVSKQPEAKFGVGDFEQMQKKINKIRYEK